MYKNYLKVTLQNLLRNRLYSSINILGLSIGLASAIVIALFVFDELSYDKHYEDSERIYRISRDFKQQNLFVAANAPQAAERLKQDFSDIEYAARLFGGQALLSYGEAAFYENNIRFADNELFSIFNFKWLSGDPSLALMRPFTVVLTESIARKYFGTTDVLGKTLLLENSAPLEITGVIQDLPHNTHLDLSVIGSLSSLSQMVGERFLHSWGSNNFHTYIKLKRGATITALSEGLSGFVDRHIAENASSYTGMTATPVRDIHLYSTRQFEMSPPGSISNVYAFSAAAFFILLIACFNFMNLSTASASRRSQEVGVRKSLGASRQQVAWQFVGESILLTFIAGVLALVLVEIMLPYFNSYFGKSLALRLWDDSRMLLGLLSLTAGVGFVAGSYPAFYLSAFKPVSVLKSGFRPGGSALFRNTLIVLQFSIAIVLVVATLVVLMQMRFANNIELGFQKERVVVLTGSPTAGFGKQWDTLRSELLRSPEILGVTTSGQTPLESNGNASTVIFEGIDKGRSMPVMRVGYDFFSTFNVPILAGREFSESYPADRLPTGGQIKTAEYGVILNRLAAEQLGWTPEQAVGKSVKGLAYGEGELGGHIIGVVENSYFESVRTPLKPLVFFMPITLENGIANLSEASIRLSGNNLQETLQTIDNLWQQFVPELPLLRHFLDEDFDALYQNESRQGSLFNWLSLLAIFIACMGLYGLATFNAERRRKEVGVRKVMGGSVWSIVVLFTNDFSKLVLASNFIAWPVAYFAMNRWLENFAYRIDLTPMIFIGSGLIALCIAWVTVGGTAAKAASQKPVLALRYE